MKKTLMFLSAVTLFSSPAFAGTDCLARDVHVRQIVPVPTSGATFITVDPPSNCSCTIPGRFGILFGDANAKILLAEALTAFATDKPVTIYGNAGCAVDNNTASVYTIVLGGGL